MSMTQISIDLDVYKALEARRLSFDEPHNAILRRELEIDGPAPVVRRPGHERMLRTSGDYELTVLGERIAVRSLREALSTALLKIESHQPGFLEKLSQRRTRRGRRIVARRPEDIYPNRPQLVEHAARLNEEWFFDTNISRRACERYLGMIGLVASIEAPLLT
jgi:hypothetical protein